MSTLADEAGDFAQQVVANFVPGATGELPATILKRMTQNVQKKRAKQLAAAGIKYDETNTMYRSPLGLPCDPREHPLLCTADETIVTTTTKAPLAARLRQNRQEKAKEAADIASDLYRQKANWNPFRDGLKEDPLDALSTTTRPPTSTMDLEALFHQLTAGDPPERKIRRSRRRISPSDFN